MAFTQEQYEAGKELMRRGSLSPERVAAFEELTKRGAFAEFEPAKQIEQETQPVQDLGVAPQDMPGRNIMGGPSSQDILGPKEVVSRTMPIARPLMEGLGSAAGAAVGTAGGIPTGPGALATGITGGALGYGMGAKGADIIEEWATGRATRPQPETIPGQVLQSAKDVGMGAVYEVAGLTIPAILGPVIRKGISIAKAAGKKGLPPLSESAVQAAAGEIIEASTGNLPQYGKNLEESLSLIDEIPGLKASLGEMTGDPGLIKLQRGLERGTGEAAEITLAARDENQKVLTEYLSEKFPGMENIDDVVSEIAKQKSGLTAGREVAATAAERAAAQVEPVAPQRTGEAITEAIGEAKAPVLKKEKELWSKIPDYEIPTARTDKAFKDATTKPSTAQAAAQNIERIYAEMPKTVTGMQTIDREISSAMASPSATDTERMVLGKVKDAIAEDFKIIGEAAENLDIGVYKGKIVSPEKIGSQIDELYERIAKEEAIPSIPDYKKVAQELMDKKIPAMRQFGEGEKAFQERISKEYLKQTGKELPIIGGERALTKTLKENLKTLEETYAGLEEAVDIGKAYKTAKEYSKTQKFDIYDKGAVGEIAKRGDFFGGKRIPEGKIPSKFMDVDNADQLVRAIGKEKAGDVMIGHYADDMVKKVVNAQTGEINSKPLAQWYRRNKPVLEKYGISDKFKSINQAQNTLDAAKVAEDRFNKSIAGKLLDADTDKAMANALGGGKNTGDKMAEMMKLVKGDKKAVVGLENAFKDFMQDQIETTAKTMSGDAIFSPAKLHDQLKQFDPAMKKLYRAKPEKYKALKNIQKAVEMQGRSAKSPLGGGSDTTENTSVLVGLLGHMMSSVAKIPGISHTVKLSSLGLDSIKSLNATEVNNLVARALYDPELAKILNRAAQKANPKLVEKQMNAFLKSIGAAAKRTETFREALNPQER